MDLLNSLEDPFYRYSIGCIHYNSTVEIAVL